jgi:hypothetical protein
MNIAYKIICFFIAICIVFLLLTCKKDDDDICTCKPVFKTEDSIIVIPETANTARIELIICNNNIKFYYTLDGEDPTENSILYNPDTAIILGIGQHLIKVKGYLYDQESEIAEKRYTITYLQCAEIENFKNHTDYYTPVILKLKNDDSRTTYETKLNDKIIDISESFTVSEAGFYYLEITSYRDTFSRSDNYEFAIMDEVRGEAEWGLKVWTPRNFTESTTNNESIKIIYPGKYIKDLSMPFIFKALKNNKLEPVYYKFTNSVNSNVSTIKRGIGSINLLPGNSTNTVVFYIKDITINSPVILEDPSWESLDEIINSSKEISTDSRIYIDKDITISEGVSVQIEAGTIIAIGTGVNIINNGSLIVNGTDENPVVFTCLNNDNYWGGIISANEGSEIIATSTIFCRSGYHNTGNYIYGHARRQALFYMDNSTLNINNCYILDNIGQIFYPVNSELYINNALIQRAKSGGQINASYISIENSVFTDFPDDSDHYIDEDNDALYINASNADISNSVFMYAKDDGIDSGADEGGIINVNNCWFEATFHEGMALSSRNLVIKEHNVKNCTFTNCGQGLELGFSSPNHIATVDSCYFYSNNIGIRYGDNYYAAVDGKLTVKNSYSINNYDKDAWNMVRSIWQPKIGNLTFFNTTVSKPVKGYPDLIVLN